MDWIVYQWGRAVWAFDHEGGAWVQGFAALVTMAVTIVLAWYTHRSLKASHNALKISEQQLRASLMPMLSLKLEGEYDGESSSFGVVTYSKTVNLTLKNIGSVPVKLKRLYVVVQEFDGERIKEQYEVPLDEYRQRVLVAQESIGGREIVEIKKREHHGAIFGLHVHASDLAEISEHHFLWHPTRGTRYTEKHVT